MGRLALAAVLLLPPALGGEVVRLQAVPEGEAALRIRVEGPPGAVVLVQVHREFGLPGTASMVLSSRRVPVGKDGAGEVLLRNAEFSVPGRCRRRQRGGRSHT